MARYPSSSFAAPAAQHSELADFLAQFHWRNFNLREGMAFSAVMLSFYMWLWIGWAMTPS